MTEQERTIKEAMEALIKEVWEGDWLKIKHFDTDTAERNVNIQFNIVTYMELLDVVGEKFAKKVTTERIMAQVFHKIHKL